MEEESQTTSMLLEDFGQKVDLTRRIREILLNYPEGTTVLKELIQNADDAGATTVRLCLDRRTHGTQSLLSDSLAQWQGPALLAYNDAVFSEDDFLSISRIGGSSKHAVPWKTGRFGVGFNSVYHVTDFPSFVSGKYVVLFDPQGIYLPNVSTANPGKRIDYVSYSAISRYKDQFSPYCAFGCDMKSPFNGTLFRFPLRNTHQAANSNLSKQAYFENDISEMFVQLFEEGVLSLLFLKCILSIEMYVWDAGDSEPRKIYSCSVDSVNKNVVTHRQALLRLSKAPPSSDSEMVAFSLDLLSEAVTEGVSQIRTCKFYIVQMMASTSSRIGTFAATAAKDYDNHLLPWASVAACISGNLADDNLLQLGRAFCFLPLPVKTGFHVQINGYFEVSSNRRGIWYGDDMDRSGKLRSIWNRLLLEDVVAPSFVKLLLGLRELLASTSTDLYYSLFPVGSFEEPWNVLVEQLYRRIRDSPVLFSNIGRGKWISPEQAYLHDTHVSERKELIDVLVQLEMPVVPLPSSLFNTILRFTSLGQQNVLTPDSLRHYLRRFKHNLGALDRPHKLLLLEYCLEDLIDTDVGVYASDLPLLPLGNGDFGSLYPPSRGVTYFICEELEYKLLHRISSRLIDRSMPNELLHRLNAIASVSGANVAIFNVREFVKLFSEFLPAEWKYKNRVMWSPDADPTHPSTEWFLNFWQYLMTQCQDLSLFGEWPIIPSLSGHLYRPVKQKKLLNPKKLSEKMLDILVRIGCIILDDKYLCEHADLINYVNDADGFGVLNSIYDVSSSGSISQLLQCLEADERDELRRFILTPKWFVGKRMDESYVQNSKWLPIYKVYEGESEETYKFSDLVSPRKFLPPHNCPDCLLTGEFIFNQSAIEEELLQRYYGIERMTKTQFYKSYVFNRVKNLESDVRNKVMLSVLQELPQLSLEDSSFREMLKTLEFVPTVSGHLRSPETLYDPRNEELHALLEDSDSFPYGAFEESGVLDMLQGLGLKTSVAVDAILQSARHVESLMHNDNQEKAHSKGKILLSYLEVNASKWLPESSEGDRRAVNRMLLHATKAFRSSRHLKSDSEKFWNDLKLISWCPVLVSPPHTSLPWPSVSSLVAPPKLVRPYSDLWLASASMRILDGECSSSALSHQLGWTMPPGGSVIAAQLLELGKNNSTISDHVFRQELVVAMPRIYAVLTTLLGSDEIHIVRAVLEGCRWIWVGDGFASSDEVVLNGPLHLAPYIRVVPVDIAAFSDLFLELGVRESLRASDYVNILHRMANKKGNVPLDPHEINAATFIAQHLAEARAYRDQIDIYLPDASGRLRNATDLVYNDAPWLLESESSDKTLFGGNTATALGTKEATVHKFVHGNISHDIAEKLGVRSLRRILLAESADSMNLSLSGAAEAFGQHEALTTRLRHILEMYADGPALLFELVQNADDAGASSVSFLLDKTQYGTSSLLSPEMGDWQGPALYCFNDSVFSSQDLYAISRIGQESKLEKPFAIGRFGLGFNSVYHFTDVPTFVSGENIVMFDPHACNLPGISPTHPGLRIKFAGKKILEQFPDQFSPFLHFGCDLQHQFPGTLFRFALRNANAATRSQIKQQAYAPSDVLSLFSSFSEVVSESLLFLRNVRTISIYVKESPESEMQLLHSVRKISVDDPKLEKSPYHQVFSRIYTDELDSSSKDQFLQKLSKSTDTNVPWRSQKLWVIDQKPSGCSARLWLTTECLGRFFRKDKFATSDRKHNKFVPWACVATLINSVEIGNVAEGCEKICGESSPITVDFLQNSMPTTRSDCYFEGRAFCFLPLPISTGFPVHVNAYFELSSNRRDIWFGDDMAGDGKLRSDWNMFLLEEVVAPAYGRLLETVALEFGPNDLFFSYWPTKEGFGPWNSLIRKLFQFISDNDLRVLYTKTRGGQWISTKQAVFPDHEFDKVTELSEALSDAGIPVALIPKEITKKFMEFCSSVLFLTPQLLRTLLIRRAREFKDKSAIILTLEYCLHDLDVPLPLDNLYGLPLIPVSDGAFRKLEKRTPSEHIYVTRGDGYSLLENSIPHQLIDCGIPNSVYDKLCLLAQSKNFNISFLTSELLANLLVKLLPKEWHYADKVMWDPCNRGHPSVEWVRILWNYLSTFCDDLSLFSEWPLLPVEDHHLMRLVENSNVIRNDGWSENMSALLQRAGCLILRRDFLIEHKQLELYVQPSTATGVLNALLAVSGDVGGIGELFVNAMNGALHELRSFILQSKWFGDGLMDEAHVNIIMHIPMFEAFTTRKLMSLSGSRKWLKPEFVREDLLDDDFLRLESEKERTLLKKYLGIKEPSRFDFYKDFVLSRMSKFNYQEQGFLSDIFSDIRTLVEEDDSYKAVFSAIPFVQASNGDWKEPMGLYDPRIEELKMFLHNDVFFPSEDFSRPNILDALATLGLRQTLSTAGLLDSARSVAVLYESGDSEAITLARRLLSCLNVLTSNVSLQEENQLDADALESQKFPTVPADEILLSADDSEGGLSNDVNIRAFFGNMSDDLTGEEDFWSDFHHITWCPVYSDPPVQGLPWLGSGHKIAAPSATRPRSQMWTVSSKFHILDGECSEKLQNKLGWMVLPDVETLSAQLVGFSRGFNEIGLNSDSEMKKQIPLIYSQFQSYVHTDDLEFLKSSLAGVKWVWIGDDFVAPDVLAFDSPVKFSPYMYVVPSELSPFQDLLLALGVKRTFDIFDYCDVLKRLQSDVRGNSLSDDQLKFVICVLETIADNYCNRSGLEFPCTLLVPDFSGVLLSIDDLVYNDAPWMDTSSVVGKRFVHSSLSYELASKLGIQSLRSLSLVSRELTKDLPCMEYNKVAEFLTTYGDHEFLLFDLLELADCCRAKKLHFVFDKRRHPCQSLLQHNLAEFQGPALVAIMEGADLNGDEVASLQFRPPWNLRGDTITYGLGLLSCFSITDLPSLLSDGCFYIFDPHGTTFSTSRSPTTKVFPLKATNLSDRFKDQFTPMLLGENMPWTSKNSTVLRMPLSSKWMENVDDSGLMKMASMLNKFVEHSSKIILFLKSILQVSLLTWEDGNPQPCLEYSIDIDASSAASRNPFSEKKWKKFQLSSIFSSSPAAVKFHVLDVNLNHRGTKSFDRWLVALSMGSGQTRNMALDRRYLAYNLKPVAGVAAHISRNDRPVKHNLSNFIMSPLPMSSTVNIPVTMVGSFLVRHDPGRYLFRAREGGNAALDVQTDAGSQLIEAWNRELMSCVRDSYIKLISEMHKIRRDPLTAGLEPSSISSSVGVILNAYKDEIYTFWPRSVYTTLVEQPIDSKESTPLKRRTGDWECLIEQVIRPFYIRLSELPVWQLYSGNSVKASDGMFLSQPGSGVGDNVLPATVCAFVKEHYPVFSVPWELLSEIQAVGFAAREVKPKMVRDLLRTTSPFTSGWSIDTYIDVLEYCLSDFHLKPSSGSSEIMPRGSSSGSSSSTNNVENIVPDTSLPRHGTSAPSPINSGGDAIEMMTSIGKALFDFGRGVVDDIGRVGGHPTRGASLRGNTINLSNGVDINEEQKLFHVSSEIKGLPCPTANNSLIKLGYTEVWVANKEEQSLVSPLAAKIIHQKVLDRPILLNIFSNPSIQWYLKLQAFSLHLLAQHMRFVFHESWSNRVIESTNAPWFSWERETAGSDNEAGPSSEWIRLFWKIFNGSPEDLTLFSEWPLIPAFLGRPILCRLRESHLVFIPPPINTLNPSYIASDLDSVEISQSEVSSEFRQVRAFMLSFKFIEENYPWLLSLLNQYNIPIFEADYLDCAAPSKCLPAEGRSLGQIIASKLVAAKHAGFFPQQTSFSSSERDELLRLFAYDFFLGSSGYAREELEVLRDLPIYRTVLGSYTGLENSDLCIVSSNTFLRPSDDRCLSYSADSTESFLLRGLGIPELNDKQILQKFGLTGFELKLQHEQEDILIYIYENWSDLQSDSSILELLKETCFVKTADDEQSVKLCKPKDLFDPSDALLASIFNGVKSKFPGERFITDGWLQILRKIGLRTSADADIILECAKRVEYLGLESMKNVDVLDEVNVWNSWNGVSSELWALAETLIKAIFSNFAVLYGNNFCNNLGDIACVPAEKGFPYKGGQRMRNRVLCSYREAIVMKDWPLAWSCAPILSMQAVVPPDYAWGALRLSSPPAFSTVLKHLEAIGKDGGEDTLAHWPTASGVKTIDEATVDILKYLEKIWSSLSSSDTEKLRQVAFLPAANGTRLVTPSALFARLTINLSPFAFELPSAYLPFVKILRHLGLQDSLSYTAAKNLLIDLQKICGYQRLSPNELRAVLAILHFICDGENSSTISNWDSEAIVPDDGCRLVHAKSCAYVDFHGSHYVKHIDTSMLKFAHPAIPDRVCEALGVRKLSSVVKEELDLVEETLVRIGSVSLASIRQKLTSASFQAAVWRVLSSLASANPSFKIPSLEKVQKSLDSLAERLQFVGVLHTRFLLRNSLNVTLLGKNPIFPEWDNISKHRALYFMDKLENRILVAEPPEYVPVTDVLSSVVSSILDSPVPLPIGALFLCPEHCETTLLDAMKLVCPTGDSEIGGGNDSLLGKEILPQDAVFVQFHPLRPFYKGEIVAWRSSNGEKLKYGKIPENVRPLAGQALYRLLVETSPGTIEPFLSSNIFSFKSIRNNIQDFSGANQEGDSKVHSRTGAESSREVGSRASQPIVPVRDLQHGQVSASEVVEAVHEMLSSAGINMDVEDHSLLQTTLTLKEQLKESQAALLLEQEKSDLATKEADTAKAAWSCRVCLSNEVDIALVPCGHVLCRRCSSAVSRCPFCRLQVSKPMRIFRP